MKYTKFYNGVLYLRKLAFSTIIVCLYDYPYAQIISISVMNFGMIWYTFYLQPIEKPSENFKNGMGEVILLLI